MSKDSAFLMWILVGVGLIVGVFLLGLLLYLLVSFAHVMRFTERRPILRAAQQAGWEALWACLTQPLLPAYFFVGRRMTKGPANGVPIIMIHGYMQNRVIFLRVARALRRSGCGPIYAINYAWWQPISTIAARLERFVERVRQETGASQVDVVAHSMGGVVAVEYLCGRGHGILRRIVTVGSPHAGISWHGPVLGAGGRELRANSPFHSRDPQHRQRLPSPVLSIASSHDNVVHPPTTSRLAHRGGHDVLIPQRGHLALLFDRQVVELLVYYIVNGELPANCPAA